MVMIVMKIAYMIILMVMYFPLKMKVIMMKQLNMMVMMIIYGDDGDNQMTIHSTDQVPNLPVYHQSGNLGHYLFATMCSSRKYPYLPMEGLGNSEGEGGLIVENFRREGGLGEHHNFPEGFLSKK